MTRWEKFVVDQEAYEASEKFDQEIMWSGDYFKWKVNVPRLQPLPVKKRGLVSTFSRASRFRMLCYVARINWKLAGVSQFLTLTYPDDYLPQSRQECARHRDRLWKNAEEYLGKRFPAMWRLEWIDRKSGKYKGHIAPHLHMMWFDVPTYSEGACRSHWRRAVQAKGRLEVKVKEMSGKSQVGVYVAKYSSKVSSILDYDAYHPLFFGGRLWGFHQKKLLKLHEMESITLRKEKDVGMLYDYLLEGMGRLNEYGNESFTLLGPRAIAARHLLYENVLDKEHECA